MRKFLQSCFACALALLSFAMVPGAVANMGAEEENESIDPNYLAGKKAVEAQQWDKAIELLSKAMQTTSNNSQAHNLLGYAYRKTGNYDASFAEYRKALKLDPMNRHAHEYIGEAYLLSGDLPKAEQHLAELQRICTPIPCEEYKELKRAVEAYKKTRQ